MSRTMFGVTYVLAMLVSAVVVVLMAMRWPWMVIGACIAVVASGLLGVIYHLGVIAYDMLYPESKP